MPRVRSKIGGKPTFFSTRNFRRAHRDALRAYGAIVGLNLDEALDEVLELGLPAFKEKAVKVMRRK